MSYTTVATQLMERDYRILRGLFESRVMTLLHIAVLYFDKSVDAARKRVWKLKNAGLVGERRRVRPYDPSILYLTRQGFERLSREQRILDYPSIGWPTMEKRTSVSPLTLQHELDVMTAKAALCSAIHGTSTHKVAEFSTWPRLFAFPSKTVSAHGYSSKVWIKPDAFIRVREADEHGFDEAEHLFYLELDRSSEPQGRLQSKAGAYAEHYRSGGLARRFGAPAAAYEEYPFRVLIVCRTVERRNNIAVSMLTRTPPILTMVWLTTLEALCRDPLGLIWIRPLDYREATRDSAFDPFRALAAAAYVRKQVREEFVEGVISRQQLLMM
jgi:hypothetical protein